MPVYYHHAKALGRRPFPIDMLRYDACFPDGNEGAAQLERAFDRFDQSKDMIEIPLAQLTDSFRLNHWTPDRWASFGWGLKVID